MDKPPCPVITRWGTWLRAVRYCANNFPEVKHIISTFDDTEILQESAISPISHPSVEVDLLEIESNYKGLEELIDKLEQLPPSIRTAYVKICEL